MSVNLQRIRTIAREKNITMRRLAQELGITPQGLNSIILNNSTTLEKLDKIAEVLCVSPGEFFDYDDNKNCFMEVMDKYQEEKPKPESANDEMSLLKEEVDLLRGQINLISENNKLLRTLLESKNQ